MSSSPGMFSRFYKLLESVDHRLHQSVHVGSALLLFYLVFVIGEHVPPWMTYALIIAVFLYLSLLVLSGSSLLDLVRKRISLSRPWQALAWTHYRGLLSDLLVRASGRRRRGEFDFVTFSSGEFQERLTCSGPRELQYSRDRLPNIDFVICDIEEIDDLVSGVTFGGPVRSKYQAVDLERVLTNRKARACLQKFINRDAPTTNTETLVMSNEFSQALQPDAQARKTLGIPLRWGYTGIGISISGPAKAWLKAAGFDLDEHKTFNLDWLLEDKHPLRQWALTGQRVVMLDWYLPVMSLLSWHVNGVGNFHDLTASELSRVRERLERLLPLMHAATPLIDDPLRLVQLVQQQDQDLIVIGGGNWLRGNGLTDARDAELTVMPISQGCLLWCECLVFLAPEGTEGGHQWRSDANAITRWLVKSYSAFSDKFAFSAYQPNDMRPLLELLRPGAVAKPRKLPPKENPRRASRQDWEQQWTYWRAEVMQR